MDALTLLSLEKNLAVTVMRWGGKPSRKDPGWMSCRSAIIDVLSGSTLPNAFLQLNYRQSVDGLPEKFNLSLIHQNLRVYGVDIGGPSHNEKIFVGIGIPAIRNAAGLHHEHQYNGTHSMVNDLTIDHTDFEAVWDLAMVRCNITKRPAFTHPLSGEFGQMELLP